MLADGRLPNLAALKARGGYSPLTPTVPAQTPVSWATFSTGLDPGGHEIFDFLKRDPANRIPTFAVAEEKSVPFLLGKSNPAAFAAGALALFLVPALLLLARRRRAAGAVLAVLGVAAAAGAFLAVRAWLPATRPWVANNRRGPVFWAEAGARPATVDPHARHVPARGVSGRTHALGPRRARHLRADRPARILHVGPVLHDAGRQRLLGRTGPTRVQRRPAAGPRSSARRDAPSAARGRSTRAADPVRPGRARPDRGRGRGGPHRAEGGAVERLGPSRLPRQPARRDPRLRADAPLERRSRRSASTFRRSSSIRRTCRPASRSRRRAASRRTSSASTAASRRWAGRSTRGRSSRARCRRTPSSRT